jgi:tRNA threonylcarbamoyladenosine biosynthesis protein TsaB
VLASLGGMLLALDTATPAITVALHGGQSVLAEQTYVDARRHGELLAPTIQEVLATVGASPADLTRIAVGVGPGPYTGLRVGLATAAAVGAALDVPVVGLCTLDVLAAASGLRGSYVVATDARRREVYWAAYEDDVRVTGPAVDRPAEIATEQPVVGAGAQHYPEYFPQAHPPAHPTAGVLAELVAQGRPTLPPRPLYLRRPDAVEPGPRKPVTAARA